MKVFIYSLEKTLFEGDADGVQFPGQDGELGVLRGHAPLMTTLSRGTVRVRSGSELAEFSVSGGYVSVAKDRSILLVQ